MIKIISFGKTELTEDKFIKPRNEWIKPIGGIWGSTYIPDEVYSSEWERWCISENFRYNWQQAVIFTLKEDAKVIEIDCVEDLNRLAMNYNVHGNGIFAQLDFEAMAAAGYDAIHLTTKGEAETRFSRPYSLYGWDVESWLILRFEAIGEQRQAIRTQMQHLMDQMINAQTATGLNAAVEGFRVAIASRGCGKLYAMQQEMEQIAMINEERYKAEVMGIISDDGMDAIRKAMSIVKNFAEEMGILGTEANGELPGMGPSPVEIKRQLKYAKNPMEIKRLNQELTAAYKRYKGGSRNGIQRR